MKFEQKVEFVKNLLNNNSIEYEGIILAQKYFDSFGYESKRKIDKLVPNLEYIGNSLIEMSQKYLNENPNSSEILNNIGALYANKGNKGLARKYISKALSVNDKDRNVFENLRYLDIYDKKPENQWQKIPNIKVHEDTIVMYFDGHAM